MLRVLIGCSALCIACCWSKPTEKKSRVLRPPPHNSDPNYDHEAFLGKDEAKTFEQLSPEESRHRLGIIVGKIDVNRDSFVSEEELTLWIRRSQQRHIDDSVKCQWNEFNLNNDGWISWDEYKNVTYGSFLDDPQPDTDYNYTQMMQRDERRFRVADTNGDLMADKHEFSAFLHPEHHEYMKHIVVQETMEDIDKNGDGFIDLKEYIGSSLETEPGEQTQAAAKDQFHAKPWSAGDMYMAGAGTEEPEWVETERQQFSEFRDKNNDGKMDKEETLDWIFPPDYDNAEAEAKHLLFESDSNKDGKLTMEEILDKYEVFVGSQVTDFGEALLQHDEF